MSLALAKLPNAAIRHFLGVEQSACGRAWRDRLDERASARALAIAQRHELPELLARILAGSGVEVHLKLDTLTAGTHIPNATVVAKHRR